MVNGNTNEDNQMVNQDLNHQLAMEAVNAVAEAADYGEKMNNWSENSTPKSSASSKSKRMTALSVKILNDEEFDVRL